MKGRGEQATDSSRDFFWSEELLVTFARCLMIKKKNPLVEKSCACVTAEPELVAVVPGLFFLMSNCVFRVLHDHTKCSFELFPSFANRCGLERTPRQSRSDFIQEWFGAILLWSRVKGTCLGNYWRELVTAFALKWRPLEKEKKKSHLLCIAALLFMGRAWAGGREGCWGGADLVFSPSLCELSSKIRRFTDVFVLE